MLLCRQARKGLQRFDRCEGTLLYIRRLATSLCKGGGNMRRELVKAIIRMAIALFMLYIFTIKVV